MSMTTTFRTAVTTDAAINDRSGALPSGWHALAMAAAVGAAMLLLAPLDALARIPRVPEVLYVWAGDAARMAPDFLAVINFNESSANYGKVIRTVPLPAPCESGHAA